MPIQADFIYFQVRIIKIDGEAFNDVLHYNC